MNSKNEVTRLAYELTYHKYLLNRDKGQSLFTELAISDYIALHTIAKVTSGQSASAEKTYLKDLADYLEMPISSVSNMVSTLKERGLVLWSHSGDGSEGTYVIITDSGLRAMERQEEILNAYYSRVIEKFGPHNLTRLLGQMEALEKVMDEEFGEKGGSACGPDETE